MTRPLAFLAAATVAILGLAGAAEAHARLTSSTPAANASVAAPAALQLQFSETLEAKLSKASLMKADGAVVAVDSKAAGKTVTATPKAALTPGGYMVMWQAVAADGHKLSGNYNFTVK